MTDVGSGDPNNGGLHARPSRHTEEPIAEPTNKKDEEPIPLSGLFEVTRMKRPIGLMHILFWIYVPFGLIFLVLKLCWIASWELLWFRLGAYLHLNDLFFRIYCAPGMVVLVHGRENLKASPNARILVANHVSEMDSVACRAGFGACHAISPSYYSRFIFTRQMVKEMHPIYIDVSDRNSLHEQITHTLKTSKMHIFCFPEGCVTNGKGVMRYHKFLFSLGEGVVPIAIRVTRPFPIHMDTLCTPVWHNILWVCLVPWQIWHLHVLPAQFPKEGETAEEFAARVQKMTADFLGVPAAPYFKKDKHTLVAQLLPQLRRRYRNRIVVGRAFLWIGSKMPISFLSKPFTAIAEVLMQPPYDEVKLHKVKQTASSTEETPSARGGRRLPDTLQC